MTKKKKRKSVRTEPANDVDDGVVVFIVSDADPETVERPVKLRVVPKSIAQDCSDRIQEIHDMHGVTEEEQAELLTCFTDLLSYGLLQNGKMPWWETENEPLV